MKFDTTFYLFLIVSFGYLLGNIRIKGFSLDISAILIVALIAGHFGIIIPNDFKTFGLAIFIYAVGLQSGPGFFETLKKEGIKLNSIAFLLLIIIFVFVYIAGKFMGLDSAAICGIFTGTMSSAPALAASHEVNSDPSISVIFGIVYPFCIILTVLFIKVLPVFARINLEEEKRKFKEKEKEIHPEIITKNFKITNENISRNKTLKSEVQQMTSTIIERVESEHPIDTESGDCQLHLGDIVRVTGTKEQLDKIKLVLGEEVDEQVQFHDNLKVLRVLVTSKNIIGKKISQIKELKAFRGVIAKVRRSGVDIAPHENMTLLLGDKLYIVAPEENAEKITSLIGNNLLLFPAADFLPISVGIVIGILVGSIPVSILGLDGVKISFVGGILITALILGRIGRTGSIVWQLSPHSTTLMKTLGQLIFMATIGTNAGKYLVESIKTHGFNAVIIGVLALIFSLLVTGHIAYRIFKLNFITVLGLLSGAMTSTPSLTMANNITKSDLPAISYAAVYPFSLIATIVLSQLILKL